MPRLRDSYLLHQGFAHSHGVDGIDRLVRTQDDNPSNTRLNGGVQHVRGAENVRLYRLQREEFAGWNLLQSCGVKNEVHACDRGPDARDVASVADVES